MTVNEYFEALRGKRVCVIGLGISNRPLVRMLLERNIPVECRDKTPRAGAGAAGRKADAWGGLPGEHSGGCGVPDAGP